MDMAWAVLMAMWVYLAGRMVWRATGPSRGQGLRCRPSKRCAFVVVYGSLITVAIAEALLLILPSRMAWVSLALLFLGHIIRHWLLRRGSFAPAGQTE